MEENPPPPQDAPSQDETEPPQNDVDAEQNNETPYYVNNERYDMTYANAPAWMGAAAPYGYRHSHGYIQK